MRVQARRAHGFVLEVDAKLTEDGVPVAIHDATLDRTTNCSGEVRTFTLTGARGLQDRRPRQPGQRAAHAAGGRSRPIVPIASPLSLARRTGSGVNLEIKNVPTDPDFDSTPAYANRVMDAVIASRIPRGQLIVQSFIAANLDVARAAAARRDDEPARGSVHQRALSRRRPRNSNYDLISPEWPVRPTTSRARTPPASTSRPSRWMPPRRSAPPGAPVWTRSSPTTR